MPKTLYDTLPDGVKVYVVDGGAVRKKDQAFLVGGHGLIYKCIPEKEIWLEDTSDKYYIMVHEAVEYYLMRDGMGYKEAHKRANAVESRARRGHKTHIEVRGTRYAICKPN